MAACGRQTKERDPSRVWLAAGALALGAGTALALGTGTAHADADGGASASGGARSAGAAASSSARDSGQRVRGASSATVAVSAGSSSDDQGGATPAPSSLTTAQQATRTTATPQPAPCQLSQTCGRATFGFTGAPQSWTVPAGVQSVYVQLQGAYGADGLPAYLGANLQLTSGSGRPAPTTSLSINVASAGQAWSGGTGGSGGYGGGGSGGSGSVVGGGGGGGGGATTVATVTGDSSTSVTVLVAGGGGGSGGLRNGSGGAGGAGGGVQTAGPSPTPDGVWPGNAGSAGGSPDNPGAGGAGGTQSSGLGTNGGDAETLSDNAGGGGGGGGWLGGSGGEPGQASASPFSVSGAGGGGGGGSSYANPNYTTGAVAGPPVIEDPNNPTDGILFLNWVDILTPALRPLRAGVTTNQQLVAATSGLPTDYSLQWSGSTGLPEGLTLSSSGVLSGKPIKAGPYSFVAAGQAVGDVNFGRMDITSVITYSGTVCPQRCGRGGRT